VIETKSCRTRRTEGLGELEMMIVQGVDLRLHGSDGRLCEGKSRSAIRSDPKQNEIDERAATVIFEPSLIFK